MKLIVNKQWLHHEADRTEQFANDSLTAWILLGQQHRFSEEMKKAHALRHAAQINSIAERRVFLKNNGVEA